MALPNNSKLALEDFYDNSEATPEELAAIVASAAKPTTTTTATAATPSAADLLAQQILAQGTTSKWTGEGWGSAEKNAADMAKILAGLNITDLNQFGEIKKTLPASEAWQGDETGSYVTVPEQTITTYGNKLTGQEVPNTYSERQTGNAWGGTFAGSGNTGYRVQFDANGNPLFYTTGASSNDLVNLLQGDPILSAAANAAAAYFGGPLGTAALQAAMGKDIEDIAKASALSYLGGQAANYVSGSADLVDAVGKTAADALGKTAGQFVAGEGKVDLEKLLLNQGVGAATNAVLGEIPGYTDLDKSTQKLVSKAVTSALNSGGNLSTNQLINLAITAGTDAAKYAPMSQEDIDSLEPGARAAYDTGGTKGYLDYQRAIRNMTGLTTSGYEGDSMGGDTGVDLDAGKNNDLFYNLENAGLTDTSKADDNTVLVNAAKDVDSIDAGEVKVKDTKATDLGSVNVTGKRDCPEGQHWDDTLGICVLDAGETKITDDKATDLGKVEVVGSKETCGPGTVLNPETGECDPVVTPPEVITSVVTPPVVTPPVVKPPVVTPPVVQPPPPVVKPPVVLPTVPTPTTGTYAAEEKTEPIYAEGMDDFNLFATLQELLAEDSKKDKKKDNKKSKDKTKMATGGHLDDLLAEQMTVDDLLKLLR